MDSGFEETGRKSNHFAKDFVNIVELAVILLKKTCKSQSHAGLKFSFY